MNAPILKPGDTIHLAWPSVPSEGADQPTARRNIQETADTYREHGVKVRLITIVGGLATPQIVAIFRDEEN
jgi:hypothetical protein